MNQRDYTPSHPRHDGKHPNCGCRVAVCCLRCPAIVCVLDIPGGLQTLHFEKRWAGRDAKIAELRAQGASTEVIALKLGVSKRSLYRRTGGAN